MSLLHLPIEVLLNIADELKYPEISALSRTCSNLYGRLNIFLYRHNVHNHNGWGMWRAIELGNESALSKFIEQGANPCAMERVGRSLYYNPYVPHEECADEEDEPGTEEITDVARQYECLRDNTFRVGDGKEPGNSDSGDRESNSDVTSPERNKRPPPPYRQPPRSPPICVAAQAGHIGVLKILLAHGANLNARGHYNRTPLIYAVIFEHTDAVSLLLDMGAWPNAYDLSRLSALSEAAEEGLVDVAKILLAHPRIDPDPCSRQHHIGRRRVSSPLYLAVKHQHAEIVRMLLHRGVDPRVENLIYQSCLCAAAENGDLAIVRMLLDKGAEVMPPRDICEEGTFLNAAKGGNADVMRLLMETGTFDPTLTFKADTMLVLAAIKGSEDLLRLLVENGLDPEQRGQHSQTALYVAQLYKNTEAVNYLKSLHRNGNQSPGIIDYDLM